MTYNNYDGLTFASKTSKWQNLPINVDYSSNGTFSVSQFHCPGSKTEYFYSFHNSFPAARDSLENI